MRIFLLWCFLLIPAHQVHGTGDVPSSIKKAQSQITELQQLMRGRDQPRELQWNRYTTKNFEILTLDDAQGRYLSDNIENIKIWTLWRWGIQDVDFKVKCKVISVPSGDLYEKLFNRKTPTWRAESRNGNLEATIWIISSGEKWHTNIPVQLTECILANFESTHGRRLPVWAHRGMSILNGRIADIRSQLSLARVDVKVLLETTPDAYARLNESQKAAFDAQASLFCLWARKEYNGKVFLDFLGGSMVNPEWSLQYLGLTTYSSCNDRLQTYLPKVLNSADNYLTW